MSDKKFGNLILKFRPGECMLIGNEIEVQILKIFRSETIVRIVAPTKINIRRKEIDFSKIIRGPDDLAI